MLIGHTHGVFPLSECLKRVCACNSCETAVLVIQSAIMADKTPPQKSNAAYATKIDPTKEGLSQEHMNLIRQVELEQWKKNTSKLRTRNVVTGLVVGALVLGIYGYTFYSVAQEQIMDEIDKEAKRARMQGPKTGAN